MYPFCLAYFNQHNYFELIHTKVYINSSFKNSLAVYFIYIYVNLFNHFIFSRNLDYLSSLDLQKNHSKCKWNCMHKCFCVVIEFLFGGDRYPEIEWLDHMVEMCLNFKELPKCFSEWLHDLHSYQQSFQSYYFSTYLLKLDVVSLSNFSHSKTSVPLISLRF